MVSVRFLKLAKDELDDTFEAFEYKQESLGYAFVQEISNSLELIKSSPDLWTQSSQHTQRCLVKNFPYSVIYEKCGDEILVVAIATLLKAPRYKIGMLLSEKSIGKKALIPTNLYIR